MISNESTSSEDLYIQCDPKNWDSVFKTQKYIKHCSFFKVCHLKLIQQVPALRVKKIEFWKKKLLKKAVANI